MKKLRFAAISMRSDRREIMEKIEKTIEEASSELFKLIRESKALGVGSCSSVDECMDDTDLRSHLIEGLKSGDSPAEIVKFMIDIEQVFWERNEIYDWEKRNAEYIAELTAAVKKAFAGVNLAKAAENCTCHNLPMVNGMCNQVTFPEIKALIQERGLTLTDMIDVVCELNGFIGVGYITFGDQIGEYIKAKARKGFSAEAWLNS